MESRVSDNIGREQVLALDIATHTGYFSLHEAGVWNFTESKRRNGNKMHGAFRTMLLAYMRRYGIRRIVAEDVAVNRHFYDLRRLSELRGILLEVCDELDLPGARIRESGHAEEIRHRRRTGNQGADDSRLP